MSWELDIQRQRTAEERANYGEHVNALRLEKVRAEIRRFAGTNIGQGPYVNGLRIAEQALSETPIA